MLAIFKKELRAYFYSPIAYVFMSVFFILTGIYFFMDNIYNGVAHFHYTLDSIKIFMLFIMPILTMRLLAEERKNKTDQLLMTSTVSVVNIVISKFLAACLTFFITLMISMIYPIILSIMTEIPVAQIMNAYIGFFMLGSLFIAIGTFISALTENQFIAAVISFISILVLWIIEWILVAVKNQMIYEILNWITIVKKYGDFAGGILRLDTIVYYVSCIVIFIFLAVRTVEKRRWS